ncbi:flavin-containing monooxygenase [Sphingobium estronivorans]|uniref:flavin-containing monooxygenase n=1 Tax=Sphingobium estronivorans TaxID=1577690 RepID=UPI00123BAAA1|nr:NAD(P)/FAD-dependent oxidoreductase [Sphingobium estronivorans]
MLLRKDKGWNADDGRFDYDAIVIGTGVGGIYQLYRLKQAGLRVLALEAAKGVGGVWWWNRYPGARLDSEAPSYGYSFSPELLEEWDWSERFAAQPELQRYFDYVVDRFDLRPHIQFDTLVTAAHYQSDEQGWALTTERGDHYRCRYLIAAVGPLTLPSYPPIPGRESFAGETCHTSRWPDREVSFAGKRVAVVGTGATGVQVIQEAAKSAAQLYVFQRTPNYCAPLNNAPVAQEEQPAVKARYPEMIAACRSTNSWFIHDPDPRSVFDLSDEEREAFLEKLYAEPGIGIWKANFSDIAVDPAANEVVSDFMRRKIRERVKDTETAERLTPRSYGFGTRRVPLETRYYEVYNQPNVQLIDVNETPIERITPSSIVTSEAELDVDIIVYATGFDAVTGSFDRIDIRGVDGARLKDKWEHGPQTFLGVHAAGFPNFFMVGGPLASLGNFTPALEFSVNWIMDLLDFMSAKGLPCVDAKPEAEREWTDFVREGQAKLLISSVKSWITGFNTNKEGKDEFRVLLYVGSAKDYRKWCADVKEGDYRQFSFDCGGAAGEGQERASVAMDSARS